MKSAEIESIPLFERLSPDERERVAAVARPERFEPGHTIVGEGEFSFDFYAITEGSAEVRRGDEAIAVLGPGDIAGEAGVVPRGGWSRRRGASVTATEPTTTIAIAGTDLRRLLEEIPALREAILEVIASRERG
ncbi:MAG TPA: cyclic nucleotide-binding domain-containing protein [Solirubrobacterales bacterium]|nr:cyclic nucleotide-binding domain-containing protein [Solirubrobacterales bacterium]